MRAATTSPLRHSGEGVSFTLSTIPFHQTVLSHQGMIRLQIYLQGQCILRDDFALQYTQRQRGISLRASSRYCAQYLRDRNCENNYELIFYRDHFCKGPVPYRLLQFHQRHSPSTYTIKRSNRGWSDSVFWLCNGLADSMSRSTLGSGLITTIPFVWYLVSIWCYISQWAYIQCLISQPRL